MAKEMYSLKDLCKMISVSYQWIDRKAREGKINFVWLGGQRMVSKEELERIKIEGVK